MGRPSKYSPELVKAICDRLAAGVPLAVICRDKGMPDPSTVWDWREKYPEVSQAIARARLVGFDAIADEALVIADTPVLGEIVKDSDKEGRTVTQEDMLGHRRLQVETRLKLLAKWDPKRYGERVEVEHSGRVELADAVRAARERAASREP